MRGFDRAAIRHVLSLARIDVVRTVRKQTDWSSGSSSALGAVVYALLLVVGTGGGCYLGYRAGQSLVDGGLSDGGPPMDLVRGLFAVFWLLLTAVFVVRAIGQRGTLAEPEGILTVVPTRQAFAGLLLAEYVFVLLWVLLPAAFVGIGLSVGAGVVLPAIAVPLAVAVAAAASVFVGIPVGLGIRHAGTRFPFVVRHKNAIIVGIFLAYFVALSTGVWNQLVAGLVEPMGRSPLGWFADLAMVGLPSIDGSPVRAAGAIAVALAIVPLSLGGGTALADRHWFSDPALAGETTSEPEDRSGPDATTDRASQRGLERRLRPVLGRPSASLIATIWRRSLRSPMKLLYAFYPLLLVAGFGAEIVRTGEVPAITAYLVLLFSAWAAGVIFTLNPLGDQGAVLSTTLLSRIDGRAFVRAHVLAGLLVAIPIGIVATLAIGLLSPLGTRRLLLLLAATPIVMVVAAGLSVGIGMAFPRFEATSVTRSIETVIPSRWAFVVFTLHLFLTAGAGAVVLEPVAADLGAALISVLLTLALSTDVTVTDDALFRVAAIVLVPLVLAPIQAYRYAVKRFDRYTLA